MELGGKSPHIVFESADLDQAANWAALGILYNTGQDCTAGSRVYVQDTIYDKFVALLVSKAKQLVVGDGFDENTTGGPVVRSNSGLIVVHSDKFPVHKVSKTQYERVFGYIESGKKEGAKAILGGEKRPGKGFFVDPTSRLLTSCCDISVYLVYGQFSRISGQI